jgi:hypothetical protein
MCKRLHKRWPCCGLRTGNWTVVPCANFHLYHQKGHIKDAENDQMMVMDCRECFHKKLAKEREKKGGKRVHWGDGGEGESEREKKKKKKGNKVHWEEDGGAK